MMIDKGLQYKSDNYFVNLNKKNNSLKKVQYRKIAITKTLIRFMDLDKNKTVLDIGCGQTDGLITQEVSKYSKEVFGIDIDEEDIKRAKSINHHKNCRFLIGDGRKLPFPSDYFDIVLCIDVIEHIPEEREKIFSEIYRVLKPHGKAYIQLENKFIIKEPHYGLYFLSWLPKKLADFYVKKTGKGKSYEVVHYSYCEFISQLKKNNFKYKNVTLQITSDARELGYKIGNFQRTIAKILYAMPKFIQNTFMLIIPEWIIILEKVTPLKTLNRAMVI